MTFHPMHLAIAVMAMVMVSGQSECRGAEQVAASATMPYLSNEIQKQDYALLLEHGNKATGAANHEALAKIIESSLLDEATRAKLAHDKSWDLATAAFVQGRYDVAAALFRNAAGSSTAASFRAAALLAAAQSLSLGNIHRKERDVFLEAGALANQAQREMPGNAAIILHRYLRWREAGDGLEMQAAAVAAEGAHLRLNGEPVFLNAIALAGRYLAELAARKVVDALLTVVFDFFPNSSSYFLPSDANRSSPAEPSPSPEARRDIIIAIKQHTGL